MKSCNIGHKHNFRKSLNLPYRYFTKCKVFLITRSGMLQYSRNWMKQKPNVQKFTEASRDPKRRWRGARACPHNRAARPRPWPCPLCVRAPWSTSDDAPSPIKTPRWEKPKHPIKFPERYHDPLPSLTQDREDPEALPGTLLERGITTGGLLHRHTCLQSDE
jgi:hypothetical protein